MICKDCYRKKNKCICRKEKKEKQENIKQIETNAWALFSLAVRLRDADKSGMCKCITSTAVGYYIGDGMEAGHLISIGKFNTKFNFKNVNTQSHYQNCFLHGNIPIYKIEIDKKYGKGTYEQLKNAKPIRRSREYLLEVIEESIKIIDENAKAKNLYEWTKSSFYTKLYNKYKK